MSDYPDWPLMLLTLAVGLWFLLIGARAAYAEYSARRAASERGGHVAAPAPQAAYNTTEENEDCQDATFERARRAAGRTHA